jgi:hypothetical protein
MLQKKSFSYGRVSKFFLNFTYVLCFNIRVLYSISVEGKGAVISENFS